MRDWIDSPREVCDRINVAVRAVQNAEDDLTRLPTWEHLYDSAKRIQEAANRLVAVVADERRRDAGRSIRDPRIRPAEDGAS